MRVRRPDIAALVGLSLICLLSAVAPTVDSDAFWHLRIGRWIVENGGALPGVETFSHTAAGLPIVVQGWLADVIHHLVDMRFGANGVRCVMAMVFVATWSAVYGAVRIEANTPARALLITGVGMVSAAGFLAPRPLLASNLGFAVVLLALLKHRATGRRAWLAVLPPVFALWGNLHFAYLAGLALIGVFMLESLLARAIPLRGHQPPRGALGVGGAMLLAVLCLGALCANPYGFGVLTETVRMAGLNAQSGLTEWARPDFLALRGALFLLPLALLAAAWTLGPRRPDWLDLLLALPLLAAAMSAQRHIPMACIAITVVAGRSLSRADGGSAAPQARQERDDAQRPPWSLAILLLLSSLALAGWLRPRAEERDRAAIARDYPGAAVAFIRDQRLEGPLLNGYLMGGFLVDRLADQVPVFIDSRYVPFAGSIQRDHETVTALRPGWETVLERHGIRLALLGPEDVRLADAMTRSGRFRQLFSEGGFTVLQASHGPPQGNATPAAARTPPD